ncbi:helix-turn-helix domain-containing protein [Paenibacillus oleatilyticus]|uniref:Helix-turn-helix domain-containing protein n=1 Tax=Paenibacillus oleatilyticus TaxID=2594886 RepID=A0ABV4VCA2_9BACL
MSAIGEYLKKIRGDMPLREAAKRSGLSHSYISSVENDKHPTTKAPVKPSPDSLKRLAKAYNHSYEELMKIAGYYEESDTSEDTSELEEISENRKKAIEEIRKMDEEEVAYFYDLMKRIKK